MTHDLHEAPEVLALTEITGLDAFAVIGRLHRVWTWFDKNTIDGHACHVTPVTLTSRLDAWVCHVGFCDALQKVGWMDAESGVVVLPNFDRHNGETAKRRATDAERQRRKREKDRGKTAVTQQSRDTSRDNRDQRREEKRRNSTPTRTAPARVKEAQETGAARPPEDLFQPTTDEIRLDPLTGSGVTRDMLMEAATAVLGGYNGHAHGIDPGVVIEKFLDAATARDDQGVPRTFEGARLSAGNATSALRGYVERVVLPHRRDFLPVDKRHFSGKPDSTRKGQGLNQGTLNVGRPVPDQRARMAKMIAKNEAGKAAETP